MSKRKQPAGRHLYIRCTFAILVSFTCVLVCPDVFSQSNKLDSLENKLKSSSGKDKANILYELVYAYLRSDMKKAEFYFEQTKTERAQQHSPRALAYLDLTRGIYESRTGLIDSGITHLLNAKGSAIESKDNYALVRIYLSLGYAYIAAGKPEKGLESMFAGLRITDKSRDQEMEFKLRTNVVWAYLELKEYRSCIDYGLQTLHLMEGTNLEWIALYTYNNVAIAYGGIGKLDSANFYILKGIAAAEKSNDIQALANGHFILGTIYSNAGKYDLAIDQYLKAKPYREKVGNPFFIVSDLYTMSELYEKMGRFREGIAAGTEALKLAKEYNLLLKFEGTYESLAKNYAGLGDFRNSSNYYKLWALAKDSVYQNANTTAIAEMQTRFETEKKEQSLSIQRAQLAQQRADLKLTYVIIGALALTLILIVTVFLLYKSRLKREKEIALRDAQITATIQSQENERRRFARDLHDGMGQLISALRLAIHTIDKNSSMEERVAFVTKSEKLLNEMHHEIRSIAFNLMPQTLVRQGLMPAINEMASRIDHSSISLHSSAFDFPPRLPELHEICLYRIIQEWVNNVIKYSGASSIEIQFVGHENEVVIMIDDNGNGFDTSLLEKSSGNGWRNIRSRLSLIKGDLQVESTEGKKGTTLVLTIPVAPEADFEVIPTAEKQLT